MTGTQGLKCFTGFSLFAGDDGGESVTVTPDFDEAVDRELGDLFSETVLPVGDKRSWKNKISNRNLEVMGQKYAIHNAMVNVLHQLEIPCWKTADEPRYT